MLRYNLKKNTFKLVEFILNAKEILKVAYAIENLMHRANFVVTHNIHTDFKKGWGFLLEN